MAGGSSLMGDGRSACCPIGPVRFQPFCRLRPCFKIDQSCVLGPRRTAAPWIVWIAGRPQGGRRVHGCRLLRQGHVRWWWIPMRRRPARVLGPRPVG